MKKCIHCLVQTELVTKDHVFPSSWYTNNTSKNVQRWTVPSCAKCNESFGRAERELFVRMIPCIDPVRPGVSGLKQKALEMLGIGLEGKLSKDEFEERKKLAIKIYRELQPHKKGMPIYPNFGPHAGYPLERQMAVKIPANLILGVLGKIFRGAEYKLNGGRLIEPPYNLEIFDRLRQEIPAVEKLFVTYGKSTHLGPGFKLERVASRVHAVLYKAVIWDTWTAYGSIDLIGEGRNGA